jgi:long-chain acyl-CoA synthetase
VTTRIHETVPRQLLASAEAYPKRDAFRHKRDGRYVDVSLASMLPRIHALACALRSMILAPGDRVAILSENRLEWAITDLAILCAGFVTVPVYATLPAGQVEYILRDSEARVIFVSSRGQIAKIREIRERLPRLERVVVYDADAVDADATAFDAVLELGRGLTADMKLTALVDRVKPDDHASIIYTSGTTGEPKGAILSHANFMANVRQCLAVFDIGPADTCLSFLPLSHVFERPAGFYVMMTAGVTIAYAESIETVPANLRETRPTVVCSVPRVYEKMYARIVDTVERGPAWRRRVFWWAVGSGRRWVGEHLRGRVNLLTAIRRSIAQVLALRTLQRRVGGRLRFFVSGGAPLGRDISGFFYAAGMPILEGYGLTETSPVLAVNSLESFKFGTVGRPLPGVEIRIADDGEILARGDNVMQGYFNKPQQTAEALAGGWFHTGDIGHVDEDGFLVITDRKKDLIATAGGKKVAPQPIEGKLKHSPFISEAVLVGNRRPFISLLIVPNFVRLQAWAVTAGVTERDHARLLALPQVHALYQGVVDGVNEGLAQFERVKSFRLLDRELSIAEGDLTPTLKVRRKIVEERYREQIDAMYGAAPPAPEGSS